MTFKSRSTIQIILESIMNVCLKDFNLNCCVLWLQFKPYNKERMNFHLKYSDLKCFVLGLPFKPSNKDRINVLLNACDLKCFVFNDRQLVRDVVEGFFQDGRRDSDVGR